MNKMKTHKGAAKRFKRTASGKLKRGSAYTSHNSWAKSHKQIRTLRKGGLVSPSDYKRIKTLLVNMK